MNEVWRPEPWLKPVLEHGVTRYIVDLKLRHVRQLSNPYEAIEFESHQGRELCTAAGIVTCHQCESSALFASAATDLRCPRCGVVFGEVCASVVPTADAAVAVQRVEV